MIGLGVQTLSAATADQLDPVPRGGRVGAAIPASDAGIRGAQPGRLRKRDGSGVWHHDHGRKLGLLALGGSLLLVLPVEQTAAKSEGGRRGGPRAITSLCIVIVVVVIVVHLEQGCCTVTAVAAVVIVVVARLDFTLLLLLLLLLGRSGRGRDADVQGLDRVGFGLAVCAVVLGGCAVGFDYVFFFEFCAAAVAG